MNTNAPANDPWSRFKTYYRHFGTLGLALDPSRMGFNEAFLTELRPRMEKALAEMRELESGAVANPDEKRMVGHYWLRAPHLAPTPQIRSQIEAAIIDIKNFAGAIHSGTLQGSGGLFKRLLVIGIGGSALGPQFVNHALSQPSSDRLSPHFFDNTDPDGMDRVIETIGSDLGRTLVIVISKSGGTKETRNGMLEAKAAYDRAGLRFEQHAVAVTGEGSELAKFSHESGWIRQFPMWDWVGGRTSELSAVGLIPAALQGFDIDNLLTGAAKCDEITRNSEMLDNPAAMLAAMWFYAGHGVGNKAMVILPYKDRLELLSKYLQQLVMESLGKQLDRSGKKVEQGLSVYGNKGSTDQHAYIQQLRDGLPNFFATFIEILRDRDSESMEVDPGATSGDYLCGFLLGTREALAENGRESITITIKNVSAFSIGVLIALFERAVGLYAFLININAYHQPGVESGKKAATRILELQTQILSLLSEDSGDGLTIHAIASKLGCEDRVETIFKLLTHLSANPTRKIMRTPSRCVFEDRFRMG